MKYRVKGTVVPPRGTPGANGAYMVDLDVESEDEMATVLRDAFVAKQGDAGGTLLLRSPSDVAMRLAKAVRRLYTEDRLTGDQMRDMAQSLEVLLADMDPDFNDGDAPVCDSGTCRGFLLYEGEYAAPGYGQAWNCVVCRQPYVRVGGEFRIVGPDDPPPELSPEDVR